MKRSAADRMRIAAVLCGAAASLPWLLGYAYSRGYDLFLWVYNAWFLRQSIATGHFPNWSPFSGSGQPFFKIAALSDGLLLAGLSAVLGTWGGVKAYVLLGYVLAALGTYLLARRLFGNSIASLISSAAYSLSWYLSITVYFQGYLSNFMSYALLPYFVLFLLEAFEDRRLDRCIAAAWILCLCITSNPQVAIKVMGLGLAFIIVAGWQRRHEHTDGLKYVGGAIVLAVCIASFSVISALSLRTEVVALSNRSNPFHSPLELFYVPLFAFQLLLQYAGVGEELLGIALRDLRFSGYPGISVVLLAVGTCRRGVNGTCRALPLWLLTGGCYATYWFVLGFLPASSWVGITHNLLVLPTLLLALLAGLGTIRLLQWRQALSAPVVLLLLVVDLGGANWALNRYGVTRLPPYELPEVGTWEAVAAHYQGETELETRFYSYNPDHTIYLYPTLMGKPTANIIELRQRNPQYESFLGYQQKQLADIADGWSPAQALALLNIGYIDVPASAFRGNRGRSEEKPEVYIAALDVLDRNPFLRKVHQRTDRESVYRGSFVATNPPGLGNVDGVVQAVYHNSLARFAFIPDLTVALLGESQQAEGEFEKITSIANFAAHKVGYLLVENVGDLRHKERDALAGVLGGDQLDRGDIETWDQQRLERLYATEQSRIEEPVSYNFQAYNSLILELTPRASDCYIFVSQQYFRGWQARSSEGKILPLFKAGAGLSAIFVPTGTHHIAMRYKNEWYEKAAVIFSLFALVASIAVYIVARSSCGRITQLLQNVMRG